MPSVAVIAGDGVGPEVVAEGVKVMRAIAPAIELVDFPWGCDFYLKTGRVMPSDAIEQLSRFDAIYMGAIGWPTVPDHVSVWECILPIRQRFGLHVNVRPVKLLPGVSGPLRRDDPTEIDMLFVRENTEGEYAGAGGIVHTGTEEELAVEVPVFTRRAIQRAARFAFEAAFKRRRHLISVTKSNASRYSYVLWDRVVADVAEEYPSVRVERVHVDAMAARMTLRPETVDVVVASNLFGDILTDLGAAIQGSLGLAASANVAFDSRNPSMFEPIHGSAPDIAGTGRANPVGAIWSAALLLAHLGLTEEAVRIETAIVKVLQEGRVRTADLGGNSSTREVGDAIAASLSARQPA